MTLVADFNMIDEQGLVPPLVPVADLPHLPEGLRVLVVDGEGTECRAEVVKGVDGPRGAYVLLAPVGGTWRTNSETKTDLTTF